MNLKLQQAITQLRNKNYCRLFLHQKDLNRAFHISENKENLNFDPLPPLPPCGLNLINHNESFHLGQHSTVPQAEVMAVEKTATFLVDNKIEGRKILIYCDSQSAIQAIDSIIIKNKTTLAAKTAMNALGGTNEITLRSKPAHCGYDGNELANPNSQERV